MCILPKLKIIILKKKKKVGIALLTSDKTDIPGKSIIWDLKSLKGLIHQEDKAILSLFNKIASKHRKPKLTELSLQGEIYRSFLNNLSSQWNILT